MTCAEEYLKSSLDLIETELLPTKTGIERTLLESVIRDARERIEGSSIADVRRAESALGETRARFLRGRGWTKNEWGTWWKGDEININEDAAVEIEVLHQAHDAECTCCFCVPTNR